MAKWDIELIYKIGVTTSAIEADTEEEAVQKAMQLAENSLDITVGNSLDTSGPEEGRCIFAHRRQN